ncbi:DUF6497 family protein [Cereibacter sp. SYSU M97828]|nr:DUF6497 family protein [Cereibacter flavus]
MDDPIPVPSGQTVTLIDTVSDAAGPSGLTLRFRFLAPDLAGVAYDLAAEDMRALCESYALPRMPQTGPKPQQIVISLADRSLPFGDSNPDATQFFEAFSVADGHCIWEPF